MADAPQQYAPSTRFTNVNYLLGNHFKFVIDALPDLSFYVQSLTVPDIASSSPFWMNPFTRVHEPGDHVEFSPIKVNYLIDSQMKGYFSLFWWMNGYGFPASYNDILAFEQTRKQQIPNPRPKLREILKTHALLQVLAPDTEGILAEVNFYDIFPTSLGELAFTTTDGDAPKLVCHVEFQYTRFDVKLLTN